ncbi:tRNA-splicing ligase rtcB domain-containing protein [Phthorimaea operculella]|nr:tRNA-splicing ligase rtcB domain-containing protein [Phthorimaea operculella]
MVVRQYNEELKYLEKINPYCWKIKKGFQPNMNVEGVFYVNATLERLMLEELRNACRPGMTGGFLPGVKQIANVAALPGNMAAFDMSDPKSIVSPGGVGFDINCGVRLLRTNLHEKDVQPIKGRALSRAKSRRNLDYQEVLNKLEDMGISIRVASPKLVMEEAPESYKNVTDVVNTCHAAGISKKTVKLRPIAVIKG